MKIITYSLRNHKQNSEQYYKDISVFTDKVLDKAYMELTTFLQDICDFISSSQVENIRSKEEYVIDFLALSVFYKVYIGNAMALHTIPQKILKHISYNRHNKYLKSSIDYIRGILITLFAIHERSDVVYNLNGIQSLTKWMIAVGDFKQEVTRFNIITSFLIEKDEIYIKNFLDTILNFGEWFQNESKQALGIYTCNVEKFLEENHKAYRYKEDFVFCGRKEVEYHLNMVGAEIMNRAFRKDFLNTKRKLLLLPACMRKAGINCKAIKTDMGYSCAGCRQDCRINELTKWGKNNNLQVFIIPHQSDAFSNKKIKSGESGIIGVACVLNLLDGGWKAKDLNFVPQCVLLDYCGCKKHWDKNGVLTDINAEQLEMVLGKDVL